MFITSEEPGGVMQVPCEWFLLFVVKLQVPMMRDTKKFAGRVVVELSRLEKLKSISVQLSIDPPELLSVKFIVELIP